MASPRWKAKAVFTILSKLCCGLFPSRERAFQQTNRGLRVDLKHAFRRVDSLQDLGCLMNDDVDAVRRCARGRNRRNNTLFFMSHG